MMQVRFYKCEHCGNVAVKVVDSGVPLVCCGEPMVELVPDSIDASKEKHVPDVHVEGGHLHVQVGSVEHPMVPEHYIQFACVLTKDGYQIHPMYAGNPPVTDFFLGTGVEPIAVYAYCNVHGLWVYEF